MCITYVKTDQNARRAVQGFEAAKIGGGLEERTTPKDFDVPDAITDTLANLMHFAEQNGINFNEQLQAAQDHFAIERTGIED